MLAWNSVLQACVLIWTVCRHACCRPSHGPDHQQRAALWQRPALPQRQTQRLALCSWRQSQHLVTAAQVLTLSQILRFDVETSVTERLRLEHLAAMALTYTFMDGVEVDDELRYFASDEYKV